MKKSCDHSKHKKETGHDNGHGHRLCCLREATGKHVNRRCGKSSKLKRINDVTPDINQPNFAKDEEDLIVKLHALLGNRWSLIAGRLPGRTEEEVRKYWNSQLKGKLISVGMDPNNHHVNQALRRRPCCSTSSCSLNTIQQPGDDDETGSSHHSHEGANVEEKPEREVTHELNC